MDKRTMAVLIMVLSGLLMWSVGSGAGGSLALEGRDVPAQAAVAPLLQYQGRLTDPATGDPVTDGNYTITFRLYDDQAGTTELWEETKDVAVVNGVFSTALGDEDPLDQGLFDGRELWLGVKVGADSEATPLQQVLPVAYALGLVPGAQIAATSSAPALTVGNAGSGDALQADGATTVNGNLSVNGSLIGGEHTHSATDINSGTLSNSRFSAYSDLSSEGYLDNNASGDLLNRSQADARYVNEQQSSSVTSAMIADGTVTSNDLADGTTLNEILDDDGPGSGLNADLLDGYSASAFAFASQTQAPLLKYRSWSEWIDPVPELSYQYFTNDKLTVTPPANGYLLITARIRYNCALDVDTQSYFGVYVTTSTSTPTSGSSGTGFTDAEVMGFASGLEPSSGAYGNFNPNIVVTPQYVVGGTTYYIWAGVRGVNVTGLDCTAYQPRIIATFYLSGM